MYYFIFPALIGFIAGFIASVLEKRNRKRYKLGKRDCRSCKNLEYMNRLGVPKCKAYSYVSAMPSKCSRYQMANAKLKENEI